jgi:antitoxin (DNA-binding transcriptional repressor) of toxin-antitoxin stability system
MKTFSIMQVQHNLAKVLETVDRGQEVGITRRKHLVARILPVRQEMVELPNFQERAEKIWGNAWSGASSETLLDKSRGER